MDVHAKNRWVAALRDPAIRQARGCMKDETGARCCLGVLEEVVLGLPISPGQMLLSPGARQLARIEHDDARVTGVFHPPSLNDGTAFASRDSDAPLPPKSFAEIADLIEQHWERM